MSVQSRTSLPSMQRENNSINEISAKSNNSSNNNDYKQPLVKH